MFLWARAIKRIYKVAHSTNNASSLFFITPRMWYSDSVTICYMQICVVMRFPFKIRLALVNKDISFNGLTTTITERILKRKYLLACVLAQFMMWDNRGYSICHLNSLFFVLSSFFFVCFLISLPRLPYDKKGVPPYNVRQQQKNVGIKDLAVLVICILFIWHCLFSASLYCVQW